MSRQTVHAADLFAFVLLKLFTLVRLALSV